MKLLIVLVSLLVAVHAVELVDETRCYDAHILSKSATPDDAPFGSFNWQVGGDYSGSHGGPGSTGSLSGFHFNGRTEQFILVLNGNNVVFDGDLNTNYEAGSAGTSIRFHQDSALQLSIRAGSAGSALDLNKNVVLNEMGIAGNVDFTLIRADGQSYTGTVNFLDQIYSNTDFNGAGLTSNSLTIWLWGAEVDGSGHGFMAGGSQPLAVDLVISGEQVDCDDVLDEADDCEDTGTCDPVDCRDTEAGCKIWAPGNCATLCLEDGAGGDCSPPTPA